MVCEAQPLLSSAYHRFAAASRHGSSCRRRPDERRAVRAFLRNLPGALDAVGRRWLQQRPTSGDAQAPGSGQMDPLSSRQRNTVPLPITNDIQSELHLMQFLQRRVYGFASLQAAGGAEAQIATLVVARPGNKDRETVAGGVISSKPTCRGSLRRQIFCNAGQTEQIIIGSVLVAARPASPPKNGLHAFRRPRAWH